MENPVEIEWNKTVLAQERLKNSRFYEELPKESRYGIWQGRPIIGRDSPINGGVYVGDGEREAIVVDDQKQPELINAYQELLRRKLKKAGMENLLRLAYLRKFLV